jgi:hypothetical protein
MDVSRLVNMNGNTMQLETRDCVSNMDSCVFVCKQGTTCGMSGEVTLQNCEHGSQPGAHIEMNGPDPHGGCFIQDRYMTVNLF